MTLYRHTQSGRLLIVLLSGAAIAYLVMFLTIEEEQRYFWLIPFAILIPIWALFRNLTIEVTTSQLKWKFGSGLIRKSVDLGDIESVEAVRNSWWYGYGIRWTPHGWLYNISGNQALEIRLRNAKKFRLGTDEPEQLRSVLLQHTGIAS